MVIDNYVRGININETQRPKWVSGESFMILFLKCILQLLQDTFHNHISKILGDVSLNDHHDHDHDSGHVDVVDKETCRSLMSQYSVALEHLLLTSI
jgi:hypothetical protein